jgi:hypothetical protein
LHVDDDEDVVEGDLHWLVSIRRLQLLKELFINFLDFERFFNSASDVMPNHETR